MLISTLSIIQLTAHIFLSHYLINILPYFYFPLYLHHYYINTPYTFHTLTVTNFTALL